MGKIVDKKITDQLAELSEILSGEAKLKEKNASAQRKQNRADSTTRLKKSQTEQTKGKNKVESKKGVKTLKSKTKSDDNKYFEIDNEEYDRIQKALREKNEKESMKTSDDVVEEVIASKIVQLKNLYTWESPMRIPIQFEKKSFIIVIALSLIFILYLTILGKYFLMLAVIAILFVIYVASVTPTTNVKHSITTRGIFSIDKLYEWFMLDEYWFSKKGETIFMIVKTKLRFPTSLIILVKESQIDDIFKTLVYRLPYRINNKYILGEKLSFGEIIPSEEFQKYVDDDIDIKSKA